VAKEDDIRTYTPNFSNVVLGFGPRSLVVLEDTISFLGPLLGLEPRVFGPALTQSWSWPWPLVNDYTSSSTHAPTWP